MKTLQKLSDQEIEELKTIGIIAKNWYAVSYDENTVPYAMFDNEAYAIAYRDKFSATSIVEPWPMIVKDYRGEPSSPTVKESYKKEIITNLLKEILEEEDLDHLCCPACGDNLGLTFKYAIKTWIERQHLNKP